MFFYIIHYEVRFRHNFYLLIYDRYRSIHADGGCWEHMDLGLCAPRIPETTTSVFRTVSIIQEQVKMISETRPMYQISTSDEKGTLKGT